MTIDYREVGKTRVFITFHSLGGIPGETDMDFLFMEPASHSKS
jgi:hypothetical protein